MRDGRQRPAGDERAEQGCQGDTRCRDADEDVAQLRQRGIDLVHEPRELQRLSLAEGDGMDANVIRRDAVGPLHEQVAGVRRDLPGRDVLDLAGHERGERRSIRARDLSRRRDDLREHVGPSGDERRAAERTERAARIAPSVERLHELRGLRERLVGLVDELPLDDQVHQPGRGHDRDGDRHGREQGDAKPVGHGSFRT